MSYLEHLAYPEPRYHGDKGEVNAVFRPAETPSDISSPAATTHYLATHESTGGEFGLYKMQMGARSAGAKTHFHRAMSESFYILSGELALYNGEKWVTGREGDFLYIPVGGLHAFKNVSDEPMSMLMLFSPGAPREEYFEHVAEMTQRGGEELKQFRVRHDSYFLEDLSPGRSSPHPSSCDRLACHPLHERGGSVHVRRDHPGSVGLPADGAV